MPVLSVRVEAKKRRSQAGSKLVKARPGKALKSKGRSAPKVPARRSPAPTGQETEVARLNRELNEAQERQVATTGLLNGGSGGACPISWSLAIAA